MATWCEKLTHWKRTWCWARLKVRGEGDNKGCDGWMASLTWWTWVWENSSRWWWTGKPGMLQSIGSQRVGHDWVTELGQNILLIFPVFPKRSLIFPWLLFSSSYSHCSLKKAVLSLLAVLWNSAFSWIYLSLSPLLFTSLLSSAICKAFSDNRFAFLLFFSLGWFCLLLPVQYDEPPSLVLQAHCWVGLIPWICSLPPLNIHRGFDLSHTWLA